MSTTKNIKLILAGSKGIIMAKINGGQKKTLVDVKVAEDTNSEDPKITVLIDGTKESSSVFLKSLRFTQLKTKQL